MRNEYNAKEIYSEKKKSAIFLKKHEGYNSMKMREKLHESLKKLTRD
jgi:hypothetical protein